MSIGMLYILDFDISCSCVG